MAELSDAQRKRREARKRRRDEGPEPSSDDGPGNENQAPGEDPLHGMKQAAKVAAASAAVGAAAAAARALTSHHDGESDREEPVDEVEQAPPEGRDEEHRPEPDEAEPELEDLEPEARVEPQAKEPVKGAALGDVQQAVERAREQLQALLGRGPEEVSGVERTHDGWVVTLEVLELERVPATTDVLASYEMELDERLNLRRYQQVRRYHRADAGRGDES